MSTTRDLRDAVGDAELLLGRLIEEQLSCVFREDVQFAVIGGAVRDTVSTILGMTPAGGKLFRDLDVAILSTDVALDLSSCHPRVAISANRYGGLKLCIDHALSVDMWRWEHPETSCARISDWASWLGRVDFDINAVAFLWPQRKVVYHASWERAMVTRQVQSLAGVPVNWRRDVVRGVGLQARLMMGSGLLKNLGSDLIVRMERLLLGVEAGRRDAGRYFVESVARGRYPVGAVEMLRSCVNRELGREYGVILESMYDGWGQGVLGRR